MRFLRPWPDLRPGVETFFLGRRRPLRTSWLMLGMRRVMLAAARSGSRWAGPRRAAERARASPRPARPADHRLALRGPRPPPRRLRRAARPHPRHRPHLARLEADASPPPAPLRRAGRRPAGLRPLAAAPRGHGADAGGARRRGRSGDGRSGLRSGPRGRQLARWLDRARARPPRSRADGYGDLPRGPPAQAREGLGKEHAACMHWGARNLPVRDALVATPLGTLLFAGPAVARPWRLDPGDFSEVLRLFADSPGFLATLPHTFEGQPKGLDEIDVPVTILWGTRDLLLLPRQAKRFERMIPTAELRYLDGLGHTPMSDDPELLAELAATTSRAPRAVAPA